MARRRFLADRVRDNLARVLRAEPGQRYEVSDGAKLYLAEIAAVAKDRVEFILLEELKQPPLPVELTLLAALIKFDRFEWMIEKATELGVAAIIPVNSARAEKGLFEAARTRLERWRRIARESSQQARRLSPPEIAEPRPLAAALETPAALRCFLDERPGAPALLIAMPPTPQRRASDSVALLTGPEGGWTDAERNGATAAGWTPVSLGPLILRAETAAITAAGILLHAWWGAQLE